MASDIVTVCWKEWKEFLLQRGSLRGTLTSILVMVFALGIFLPMQMGAQWAESPMNLAVWAWVPLFLVSSMIADSFAGERERHTLETLLASCLEDRAILLGKVLAAVAYAMSMMALLLVVSLVTVNVTSGSGRLLLYRPEVVVGAAALGSLAATLVSAIGVLLSLRAASVRQAAQSLSIGIMMLIFVPVLAIQALPREWQLRLAQALSGIDGRMALAVVVVVLLTLDVVFLALALARFQRSRLILD